MRWLWDYESLRAVTVSPSVGPTTQITFQTDRLMSAHSKETSWWQSSVGLMTIRISPTVSVLSCLTKPHLSQKNYQIKFLPFLLETKDMKALDTRSPNIFSVGQFIFSNSKFFPLLFFFFQYSIFSNTDITWGESLAQLYQVRAWRWFSQRVAAVTSVFGEQSGWRISFNSFRDCFLSLSGRVSAELIKHRRKYYFINLN